jgi:hypothetical protein
MDVEKVLGHILSEDGRKALHTVIQNQFGLGLHGNLIPFTRNTQKTLSDCALQALQKIGHPALLSGIKEKITEEYPEMDINIVSLRNTLTRNKDIFISFGRTSTYGLKQWETENKAIKGGTIRDIVEEFLKKRNEPCHLDSITRYVKKFRKTTFANIWGNLKLSGDTRFTFPKSYYVGLKDHGGN